MDGQMVRVCRMGISQMDYHKKSGNKDMTRSGEASASNMGLEVYLPYDFIKLVSSPPP